MAKNTLSASAPPRTMKSLMVGALTSNWFISVMVLIAALAFSLFILNGQSQVAPKNDVMPVNPLIEEELGIRVTQVAVSGDEGLIDFRYQVLDPDKAEQVMSDPNNFPVLIAEDSNIPIKYSLYMPHHEQIVAGRTYYLLFYNSGGVVKAGDFVTVLFGDLKLEHVPVK